MELGLPVIFVIWNNNGYGEIKRFMEDSDITRIGVDIFTPDFIGLGRAFGCEVAAVKTLEELKAELMIANERQRPTLLEITQNDFVDGYPMP